MMIPTATMPGETTVADRAAFAPGSSTAISWRHLDEWRCKKWLG